MSFLTISLRVSWFTSFQRVTYLNPSFSLRSRHLFNPSISSLELSWVIFHLKLSLRIVAIYGGYKRPKFFIYPSALFSSSSHPVKFLPPLSTGVLSEIFLTHGAILSIVPEAVCSWFHQVSSHLISSCSIPSIYSRSVVQIISLLFILISFQPKWFQFLLVHCARQSCLCNLLVLIVSLVPLF